jgi:hypothetical protein
MIGLAGNCLAGLRPHHYGELMITSKSILIVCSLIFLSSAVAHAQTCEVRDIKGVKHNCCKKSVEKKPGCDDKNLKEGDKLKCGIKTETTWDCTPISDKKPDKPADKKADKQSDKPADAKSDKQPDKKSDKQPNKPTDKKTTDKSADKKPDPKK